VLATTPSALGEESPRQRELRRLRRAREAVLLLSCETGVCSGTLLDAASGLVAASKSRLEAAGSIEAFRFVTKPQEGEAEVVEREPLGRAELLALAAGSDAALLKVRPSAGLRPYERANRTPAPGDRVTVAGVMGGVRFPHATDLWPREGTILDLPPLGSRALRSSAPVHLNSAGGAVLDADGRLVGIATPIRLDGREPGEATGAVTPLALYDALLRGEDRLEDASAFVAPRGGGPPPFIALSSEPGGPPGKRVDFTGGVFAIKESRTVLASGWFVLDQHDALEYFACPVKNGKLHETVIALDTDPAIINLAMIALGYQSGGGVQRLGDPAKPIGDRVRLFVEWDWNEAAAIAAWLAKLDPPWQRPSFRVIVEKVQEGEIKWEKGPVVRVRAEDLMFGVGDGAPMVRAGFIYSGSSFGVNEETGRRFYKATAGGVLAAVYRDPDAVFNTPLESGEDDTYYRVRDTICPPRGTRCLLIIMPGE